MMLAVPFVAIVLALVEFWTSEEARKNRAHCFRTSADFARYAGTLRLRVSASTMASEKQQVERSATECESTSWGYWWLAFRTWAEVPDNPFLERVSIMASPSRMGPPHLSGSVPSRIRNRQGQFKRTARLARSPVVHACPRLIGIYVSFHLIRASACAYRVRNGGLSCSQFARDLFETGRWWSGARADIVGFRLCAEAVSAVRKNSPSQHVNSDSRRAVRSRAERTEHRWAA